MIRLRLQRRGRKRRPYYHIVVADKRSPRDGRVIERVGRFDNVSESKEVILEKDRIIHWLSVGAQPSDTVRTILKQEGILYQMHLIRWGKSEEEIAAALEEWRENRSVRDKDEVSKKEQQKSLLAAEEKEYKRLVEEKSAEAARAAKQQKIEAEQKKAEEEAAVAAGESSEAVAEEASSSEAPAEENKEVAAEEPASQEATEEQPAPKAEAEAETPAEEPEVKTEAAEAEVSSEEPADKKTEAAEEPAAEEPEVKKEEAQATAEKAETEESGNDAESKQPSGEEAYADRLSTAMTANEAIAYIKDKAVDELAGFVPEDEDRVTVLRAWESKQAE